MPAKNTIRRFEPESMYHVYNRGVEKRIIFYDERDYAVFLSFLKYALLPEDTEEEVVEPAMITDADRFSLRRLNLVEEVDLVSFCLMPNHFHLLLFQHSEDAITRLMRSVATGYSMYFNKRYDRVGALFQGKYKASRIGTDSHWRHISRYIHLNPLDLGENYKTYSYSSYHLIGGASHADWLKPEHVLDGFKNIAEYESFHDEYIPHRKELQNIKEMLADA